MQEKFPIIKAGFIFNKFNKKIDNLSLIKESITINYPCRLDAMAINPAAVCYNDSMIFTPGEVVFSLVKEWYEELRTLIKEDHDLIRQIELTQLLESISCSREPSLVFNGKKYPMSRLTPRFYYDNG